MVSGWHLACRSNSQRRWSVWLFSGSNQEQAVAIAPPRTWPLPTGLSLENKSSSRPSCLTWQSRRPEVIRRFDFALTKRRRLLWNRGSSGPRFPASQTKPCPEGFDSQSHTSCDGESVGRRAETGLFQLRINRSSRQSEGPWRVVEGGHEKKRHGPQQPHQRQQQAATTRQTSPHHAVVVTSPSTQVANLERASPHLASPQAIASPTIRNQGTLRSQTTDPYPSLTCRTFPTQPHEHGSNLRTNMLDDDARRTLEQEAIALVNLSSGKPTRAQPNQQPISESVTQSPPIHELLQQHKATLMARRDDSSAPHPHRVKPSSPLRERERDRTCLSMSLYVNGIENKMNVVPTGKASPDHHAAFEMTRVDHSVNNKRHAQDDGGIPVKHEGPITCGFGVETPSSPNELQRISMQSLLVTLKKRKAEDDEQTNSQQSLSSTKLPRFRDVFEQPRLPETQPVQTTTMHAPPVQFSAPQMMPAPSSPSTAAPVLEESSPYPPPPELKCKYRTGKCNNVRALKSCGDYHNLCNYHRLRANANQRKLDRKKKEQRQQYPSSSPTKVSSPAAMQSVPPAAAAAAALAAMPTSFISSHQHRAANGSSAPSTPFLPYMMPPMDPGSSKSSLRPKPESNAF